MFVIITTAAKYYMVIGQIGVVGAGVVSVLFSFGLYNVLASLLIYLMNKSRWLKKKILSGYYMEGTWVGYYERNNDIRLVIEHFEQDLNRLVIRGRSRMLNGEERAKWYSKTVQIDVISGRLIYVYENGAIRYKGTGLEGIGTFFFQREGVDCPPTELDGFQVDTIDGERVPAKEKKVADVLLPLDIAFEKSLELYKKQRSDNRPNNIPLTEQI